MGTSGPTETLFVVASTDMKNVNVLMDRIRLRVGSLPQLKASGSMNVTAEVISAPPVDDARTLEQQVWAVGDYVTDLIQQGLWKKD